MVARGCAIRRSSLPARVSTLLALGVLAWAPMGCSLDGLLKTDEIPDGTTDPAITQTHDGALAAYHGEVGQLRLALGGGVSSFSFIATSALLGDEMRNVNPRNQTIAVDLRQLPEVRGATAGVEGIPFTDLNNLRGQGSQAIGLLTRYAPELPALVGHTYALQAYAEIMLADLYCSGIPLSTLDYDGDYTVRPGSTTADVLTHAVTLFDSALAFVGDSVAFRHLAAVGKGRALLNLGRFADAAEAVVSVPDDYHNDVGYSAAVGANATNFINRIQTRDGGGFGFGVADHEGGTGLDYVSSGDPRTAVTSLGLYSNDGGLAVYRPDKYAADGSSSIVLASGVEARLIEAEAALQAGDIEAWLATLNRLRTSGSTILPPDTIADTLGVSGCGGPACGQAPGGDDPVEFGQPAGGFVVPSGYTLESVDTTYPAPSGVGGPGGLCDQRSWYRPCYQGDSMVVYSYISSASPGWAPGVGGFAGLAPLDDPGTAAGRVDLLFRERAFWLFLTGHRQGDMRRLIRQYGRSEQTVYATGAYPGGTAGLLYGHDVAAPVPVTERNVNTLYTGCISRGA